MKREAMRDFLIGQFLGWLRAEHGGRAATKEEKAAARNAADAVIALLYGAENEQMTIGGRFG